MQPFARLDALKGRMRAATSSAPAVAQDRDLAEALLLRGDEASFRELYRRHTPRLHQLVLRIVGGAEADAEDVVQDTWIRAVERLDGFRWEAAFSTWLTGIGLNVARGMLRRRGRWEVPASPDAPEPWRPPPHHAERMDLERAIALLPAGYRAVLVLHDVEGFTHEEIGEQLGIAPGTSKSQLSHARRAVRRLLGPAEEVLR
ncbi:MAG: polymerase sigma factor, sigma-70 family [Gemmatimonadetes bacterium]|nr:polymerase sigma factor, sigma-70 family [Gemmatimonadota bacterium]